MMQEKEMDCQTLMCDSSTRVNHCFLMFFFLQYLFIVSEHHHVVPLFKAHLSDQLS